MTQDQTHFEGTDRHWVGDSSDERWHRKRVHGIGGSEIAAVVGLSPWSSAFSLWHRKAGQRAGTWPVVDHGASEAMIWGTLDEPTIAQRYADLHPEVRLHEAPLYTSTAHPWMIANPDRIVELSDGTREVLEIKTSRYDDHWRQGIPIQYRCQVLWYLHVLGLERARLICRFGGCELKEYEVLYDEEDAQVLQQAGADFMASLDADLPPPIDSSASTHQTLRELPEGQEDVDVDVDDGLLCALVLGLRQHKAATNLLTGAKSMLLAAIGTGRRAVTQDTEGNTTVVATRTVRDGKTYSLITGRGVELLADRCETEEDQPHE